MTSQYRHRRTSNPATPAPTLEPGEIAVNTANRQLHLGDAASATLGTPKALLAIRFFDTAAIYAIGDLVIQAGKGYRAIVANGPGAFNITQWELSGAQLIISTTPPVAAGDGTLWWNNSEGVGKLYVRYNDGNSVQWVEAAPQPAVNQFVQKAGDTMTGNLIIRTADSSMLAMFKAGGGANYTGIQGYGGATPALRWQTLWGNGVAESTGDNGSNFEISRFSDAGAYLDSPIEIRRSTGIIDFAKKPTVAGQVWAAPFDALAYSGMQVNGSFDVSQERGASPSNALYHCDVWTLGLNAAPAAITGTQTNFALVYGLPWHLSFTVTTANAALTAGQYAYLGQNIEGSRVARLGWGTPGAMPLTLAFTTAHHRTGTYSIRIGNFDGTRSYVATYTQNVADVGEYKVITVPGCTDGTWQTDNRIGISLVLAMACGTNYTAPSANSIWHNANYVAAPGQINAVAATSDAFRITGVVLLPGIEAPPAARSALIMRPYDQELLACKRYYYKGIPAFKGIWQVSNISRLSGIHPVSMRVAPAVSLVGTVNVFDGAVGTTITSLPNNFSTTDIFEVNANTAAVMTEGRMVSIYQGGSGYIAVDARL